MFWRTLAFWWIIIPAILLGLIVGAIPGFSAANTIIILLPLTLALEPELGLTFMVALYASSRMGAGIPAILVNIPGTAGAAATPLDGYPMTKQGRGQQALAMSFVASIAGGLLTTILALIAMPWLSQVAFYLHSVEMIVIMLLGISLIASIAAKDTLKGLIAGFFGLMLGFIGADVVYETPRGTFGFLELYDKVPLVPALVGLFAISEAFVVIERETILSKQGQEAMRESNWSQTIEGRKNCAVQVVAHYMDQHCWPGHRRCSWRRCCDCLIRRLSAVENLLENSRALWNRTCRGVDRTGVRQQWCHVRNSRPAPCYRYSRWRYRGHYAGRTAVSRCYSGTGPLPDEPGTCVWTFYGHGHNLCANDR